MKRITTVHNENTFVMHSLLHLGDVKAAGVYAVAEVNGECHAIRIPGAYLTSVVNQATGHRDRAIGLFGIDSDFRQVTREEDGC